MVSKKRKNKKNKSEFIIVILISVLLGLSGGVVGQIFAGSYLSSVAYKIPYWGEINFSEGAPGGSVVISDARKVVVEQDMKISETINSSNTNIVGIFRKKEIENNNNSFNLNDYYNLNEERGQGIIITSDGWVITSAFSPSIRGEKEILEDYVVISYEGKVYNIDKILRDSSMDFGFLHITGAKDLNEIEFVENDESMIGKQVLAVNWEGKGIATSIIGENGMSQNLIKSSDYYERSFEMADELSENFNGGFVFDLSGRLVSIINNQGDVKSIDNLRSSVKSVLAEEKIKRGSLGVSYINLEDLASPIEEQNKGALIYEIEPDSATKEANLQKGDIITFVNNIEVNKKNELNDILQNYMADERVSLTYIRDGEKSQIDIVLEEY